MSNDSESLSPPPPVSAFVFLRKPLFIFSVLFVAWIFLGKIATHFMPHRPDPTYSVAALQTPSIPEPAKEKDAQIAELQHRLDEMDARFKTLQDTPAAAGKPSDDSATQVKIAALQASLDALTQAHSLEAGDAAHLTEALRKQEEDIATLKTQLADTQAKSLRRLSLMAAFGTLKDAAQRGESFAEPLQQMNDLAKDDAPIQALLTQLAPYAKDGAATLPMLQSQFEAAIPQALAPDNSNTLMHHLQSLIRIRKVGEQQTGGSDEAIIARAEAKLNRGDVKAGADELATLSPPAAAAFATWVGKAQAFLLVQNTLAGLQPALLQDKPASVAAQ